MEYDFDVAVIGSGVGGLCAGALLARRGYRTLLTETLDRWGGRFSTVEENGFLLPTGAILLHRNGPLEAVFKEVGVEFEVVNLPKTLHCRIEGKDYPMRLNNPLSLIDVAADLEISRGGLVRLGGSLAREIGKKRVLKAFGKGVEDPLGGGSNLTFREWLMQYTDNEVVHKVFDAIIVGVLACRSWELPASQFFYYMTRLGSLADAGVAPKGNVRLVQGLVDAVREKGEAWLNSPARRIVVKRGSARGVVVEREGREVEVSCRAVISDTGPKRTVELAGSDNFDDRYLREVRMRLRAGPAMLILVGSDRPVLPEGAPFLLIVGARRLVVGGELAILCPGLAPPGKHLSYYCGYPLNSLLPMEVEWEEIQCRRDLEEHFPDIREHGEILRMEAHDVDSELPGARAWPGYDMPPETSIRNLYNVGEGVRAPGWSGTNKAAQTAIEVAHTVSKVLG
ncbi:FAD-dependent oxidoreductase [Candidatus Solincola tengchongensis]|uniref:phytoene desaturase family protein n=1 Tax=Candidatus Solincola tengchongensis TaxID=2900693 RepID=UPI00257F8B12|nr:FAD-dependent oxidoreductase [Candidatus Solincola tengchongensis]